MTFAHTGMAWFTTHGSQAGFLTREFSKVRVHGSMSAAGWGLVEEQRPT